MVLTSMSLPSIISFITPAPVDVGILKYTMTTRCQMTAVDIFKLFIQKITQVQCTTFSIAHCLIKITGQWS